MSNSKISYGDVMYCIVSIVNNTVLHTRKFLRDCFFNLLLLILHQDMKGARERPWSGMQSTPSSVALAQLLMFMEDFPLFFLFFIFFPFLFSKITSLWDLGSPLRDQTWASGCETVDHQGIHMFKFLVRTAVGEKLVSCQHHRKPSDNPFLHIEILVIPVITSSKCSSNVFRDEILDQYPVWQLP